MCSINLFLSSIYRHSRVFFIVLGTLSLVGCDNSGNLAIQGSFSADTPVSLIGTWRSGCIALSDLTSTRETLEISDGYLTSNVTSFVDDSCNIGNIDKNQSLMYNLETQIDSQNTEFSEVYNYRLTLAAASIGDEMVNINETIFSRQIAGKMAVENDLLSVTDDFTEDLVTESRLYSKI